MDVATKGDKLFDVKALIDPLVPVAEQEWVKIGEIILDSDMYTSLFGDERLFFRHQRVETDKRYWPKAVR